MSQGENLLSKLYSLLQDDPDIDEIGLLFGISEDELTPDNAFYLDNHKLGVAFTSARLIFRAAESEFHHLYPLLRAQTCTDTDLSSLERVTRVLLLLNADFYTALNARRQLACRSYLSEANEILFCDLVFSLHPKSIDTWAYRRWVSKRILQKATSEEKGAFYTQQTQVCQLLAERHPRNYHAWSFRHWVVEQTMTRPTIERELESMKAYCKTHVKDHSGWNHRQRVISLSFQSTSDDQKHLFIASELAFLSHLQAYYSYSEAPWCHRRFLLHLLFQLPLDPVDKDVEGVDVEKEGQEDGILDAKLQEQWTVVLDLLENNQRMDAIVLDIQTAGRLANRYAVRYACWAYQKLRRVVLDDSIDRLGSDLKARRMQDAALQNISLD